ncbi:MAG: HIT domain-containing protein [Planctomycetota bacterium]
MNDGARSKSGGRGERAPGEHALNQERLWAPWRLGYIKGQADTESPPEPVRWVDGADEACFLCRAAADYGDNQAEADEQNLVAWRGEFAVVVLNRYPYANGHVLVAPRRHTAELADLTDAEHLEIMQTLSRLTRVLGAKVQAQGFNIGLNLGRLAGAGVPGHLHWHLVPRWPGDHNFMPVLAGVRVIPQSLDELWRLLRGELS